MVWLHVKWFCTRCIQRCQTHHLVMLIDSALLLATPAMASSIGISPGEIIIEAGARWGKAKVFNNGNEAVTLRLSLVDMMMTSSGALEVHPMPHLLTPQTRRLTILPQINNV